jgi:catechol 2,3-dioxygenase
VSAGGYHHHIGLNTWRSQGAQPTPEDHVGLQRFVMALPTQEGLLSVKERLVTFAVAFEEAEDGIRVDDPWGHHLLLQVQPMLAM